jgi:hypothetical protein
MSDNESKTTDIFTIIAVKQSIIQKFIMILYIVYLERKKSKDRENVRMQECANMIISLRSPVKRP